jgi:hypothetical protein
MFWFRDTLMLTHLLHLEIIKSPRYFGIEQLFITTFQQNVPFILRWTVFIVEEYQEQGNQPSTGYEQIVDTFFQSNSRVSEFQFTFIIYM